MSEEWPSHDFSRLEKVYGPLAESVRRLIDITIRTAADPATVATAKSKIESVAEELSASLQPGPFGVQLTPDGETIAWGNVVIGLRNPVAPPLVIHHDPDGLVWVRVRSRPGLRRPTGPRPRRRVLADSSTTSWARPHTSHLDPPTPAPSSCVTFARRPLGRPLRAEAHVERIDGVKTFSTGHIADDEGPTVEAEGIFISPKQTPA